MPHSWPLVPLGDVLTKSVETTDVQPAKQYKQVTVRLWGKGVTLRAQVLGNEIAADRQYIVRKDQFITSRIDARNGAFGLIPIELDGAIVSNDFPVFNLDGQKILPAFLDWMSKTQDFIDRCRHASEGTTNRVRLKEDLFMAVAIPLPPLDEQRRIVARIAALATRISEARGLRAAAVEESSVLLKSSLNRTIQVFDSSYEVALEEVCEEIIDNLHSNPVYSETGVPCIRSPDVGWGMLYLSTALKTSEEEYQRRCVRGEPKPGDIVLVREGGGTGKAALVQEGQRFSLGQRVMMLRVNPTIMMPRFFLHQLISPAVYEEQIVPLSKGSASPHLNISALRRFTLKLPPLSEQRRIVAYLDEVQARVDAIKALQSETAAELAALLPSVLDRAFRGEL